VTAEPTVLVLDGELCIAELPDLRGLIETALTAGAQALTIDLADVTLLTAGIAWRIRNARRSLMSWLITNDRADTWVLVPSCCCSVTGRASGVR
jgi:hypothetical protein